MSKIVSVTFEELYGASFVNSGTLSGTMYATTYGTLPYPIYGELLRTKSGVVPGSRAVANWAQSSRGYFAGQSVCSLSLPSFTGSLTGSFTAYVWCMPMPTQSNVDSSGSGRVALSKAYSPMTASVGGVRTSFFLGCMSGSTTGSQYATCGITTAGLTSLTCSNSTASGALATGSWNMLCMTYDSGAGALTLYLNGSSIASASTTPGAISLGTNGPLCCACESTDVTSLQYALWGFYDDVTVYDSVLSSANVVEQYRTDKGWFDGTGSMIINALLDDLTTGTFFNSGTIDNSLYSYGTITQGIPGPVSGTFAMRNTSAAGVVMLTGSSIIQQMQITGSLTCYVWCKPAGRVNYPVMIHKGYRPPGTWAAPYYSFYIGGWSPTTDTWSLDATITIKSGSGYVQLNSIKTGVVNINTGSWGMYGLTWDKSTGVIKTYVNGNPVASASGYAGNVDWGTTGNLYVGGYGQDSPGHSIYGDYYGLKMYDYALSPYQMQMAYLTDLGLSVPTSGTTNNSLLSVAIDYTTSNVAWATFYAPVIFASATLSSSWSIDGGMKVVSSSLVTGTMPPYTSYRLTLSGTIVRNTTYNVTAIVPDVGTGIAFTGSAQMTTSMFGGVVTGSFDSIEGEKLNTRLISGGSPFMSYVRPTYYYPERVPPTISNVSPTPGTELSGTTPISFDVNDASGLLRVIIEASYASSSIPREVVHDGDSFGTMFTGPTNVRTSVSGTGLHYVVLRDGEWPGPPTIKVVAIDVNGNEL